jgi:hypothetical protein
MQTLTPAQEAALRKLAGNHEFYSAKCLKIVDKTGMVLPLKFNRTQRYIMSVLEKQKQDTGMVRAVILKGRQQGFTTYIQARYFHRTSFLSKSFCFRPCSPG